MSPFDKILAILLLASIKGFRSGCFACVTGVGTVTIKQLQSIKLSRLSENCNSESSKSLLFSISKVESTPFFNSLIRSLLVSNPVTERIFANSTAKGRPTYPKPIIAIFKLFNFVIYL